MKTLLLLACLAAGAALPCAAKSVPEPPENVARASEAALNDEMQRMDYVLRKMRAQYADDAVFLELLEASQKTWADYCEAFLAARLPRRKGDDDVAARIAYATLKRELVKARLVQIENGWKRRMALDDPLQKSG